MVFFQLQIMLFIILYCILESVHTRLCKCIRFAFLANERFFGVVPVLKECHGNISTFYLKL